MSVPVTEPVAVTDVFATGLLDVEAVSPTCWRVTFYVRQKCLMTGTAENVVVARLVLTAEALAALALRRPPDEGVFDAAMSERPPSFRRQ